ncbi:hypothetical protein ACN47E_004156 [Coniothyrium glycines]
MQFTTIIATILSMAAIAIAAPVGDVEARQTGNHGMCVKSTAGTVEQIANC